MKIYLCSRVALDAHELNNSMAAALRTAGHEVFVPHEEDHNEVGADKTDLEIYRADSAAMLAADACVVVGRIGVDCAFEIGWFQAKGLPVFWLTPHGLDIGRHPMLYLVQRFASPGSLVRELNGGKLA